MAQKAVKQVDPKKTVIKDKKENVEEKPEKKPVVAADKKDKSQNDKSPKEDKVNIANNNDKKEKPEKKDDNKDKIVNDKKDNNNNNKGVVIKDNNKDNKENNNNRKISKTKDEEPEEEIPKVEEPSKGEDKNIEEIENAKVPQFSVSDEVVLTKDRMGIIRYKGRVPEMGIGIFYGVELTDGSVGHNDGQVKGKGTRYFQTEASRAMFVGHEKIRRKMTVRDHKRIDSFHGVSKKDDGKISPKQSNQDDEKESVITSSEQERQRQQSLAQRDEQTYESKEYVSVDGLEPAHKMENILQFILRQNNKFRDLLLDTYANPQTHTCIVHAFVALQELQDDQQRQGWNELIKRWQKFL